MATTRIAVEIANITGESADADFIVSAQKFVVANIPKNLMRWACSETASATHGGDDSPTSITLPVGTDNIIAVRRDAHDAVEATLEDRAWLESTSGSLKKPTDSFPRYYITAGNQVRVKPDPTSSKTAHVTYIDFSKVDDDSDLRNVVINYACFKEFAKLMMADARQGDFSANSSNMGTEHWIRAEEDSEMLMARIQTIQAQLGERTHFGQMSQQHYNLALAEIKSYIENNPKTLATAMAMQGAK